MQTPEEVQAILKLASLGWGTKRIAAELGCSRNTVRNYIRQGGWQPYRQPRRQKQLGELGAWLEEKYRQHRGNCDVIHQDLTREHGISVSVRTVQRAVAHLRQQCKAEAVATLRFETPPGHQLQIDFGSTRVSVAAEQLKVHLFVATLGYSRRCFVEAFLHERQSAWFQGLESTFGHFGGIPRELLLDNAKALVRHHDVRTREVAFNDRFHAFCRYWQVIPKACAPYRPRTKGKDERGVGYVKGNAIAGHQFRSFEHLRSHLQWWMREIADLRTHGTTGEAPMARFHRDERQALRPLPPKAPFLQVRELIRRVHADACVEVDTNRYSVPWRLIGERVTVIVADQAVRVLHAAEQVACHVQSRARCTAIVERAHLAGIVGSHMVHRARQRIQDSDRLIEVPRPELLRPLDVYEKAVGGGW